MANTIFEKQGGTYTQRLYVARFITGGKRNGSEYRLLGDEA